MCQEGFDLKERAKHLSFLAPGPRRREQYPTPMTYNPWKPLIAEINGHCHAAGRAMAQECDIRIAGERARFAITEVKVGVPVMEMSALFPPCPHPVT